MLHLSTGLSYRILQETSHVASMSQVPKLSRFYIHHVSGFL